MKTKTQTGRSAPTRRRGRLASCQAGAERRQKDQHVLPTPRDFVNRATVAARRSCNFSLLSIEIILASHRGKRERERTLSFSLPRAINSASVRNRRPPDTRGRWRDAASRRRRWHVPRHTGGLNGNDRFMPCPLSPSTQRVIHEDIRDDFSGRLPLTIRCQLRVTRKADHFVNSSYTGDE